MSICSGDSPGWIVIVQQKLDDALAPLHHAVARLEELAQIADRVTVMRDGRVVEMEHRFGT